MFKQNYFELFGLPQRFELEDEALRTAYQALQLKCHPDRFANQGAQAGRLSAQLSSFINDGYRILKDPLKRAIYLLALVGVPVDLETDTQLDAHFLMKQMKLREELQEMLKNEVVLLGFQERLQTLKQDSFAQFLAAYHRKDYVFARKTVRELQFFGRLEEEGCKQSC